MEPALTPRPVAATVEEMLAEVTDRTEMHATDSKSGARFERVTIDGERYVVKHLSRDHDWIMRAVGDIGYKPVEVWRSGILDLVPATIDSAYVGACTDLSGSGRSGAAILLRDVSDELVPEGDEPIPLDAQLGFMEHMAEFHAAFWGWSDSPEWTPLANRYTCFGPSMVKCEELLGFPEAVPRIVGNGWARFGDVAPQSAPLISALLIDPDPLVRALHGLPATFMQGDWKMGNLGRHPDGRTILIDWANPGIGPGVTELTWYLALNRARLPLGHSKDDAIEAYRAALERHGIDTQPWWDRALALAFLGAFVEFGWEKALGDPEELAWWEERALAGATFL